MTPQTTFANGVSPFTGLVKWRRETPEVDKPVRMGRNPANVPTLADLITAWMTGRKPVASLDISQGAGLACSSVEVSLHRMLGFHEVTREKVPQTTGERGRRAYIWLYTLTGKSDRYSAKGSTRTLSEAQVGAVDRARRRGATMAVIAATYAVHVQTIRSVLKREGAYAGML